MKTTNQRGFGIVEVITVVVVLALIGVGGWYVWQAQTSQSQQSQSSAGSNTPSPEPSNQDDTHSTFTHASIPFTFKYPKDWTLKIDEKVKDGQALPDNYTVSLLTKDVAYAELPIGGSEVSAGAQVIIRSSKTALTDPQGVFTGLRVNVQEKTTTTIAGLSAVEYEWGYESQPGHYVDFINGGRLYSIGYFSAGNERSSANYAEYKAILNSFAF